MNRRERRSKKVTTPRVLHIIAGDAEMLFTPATIDRVWKEWEAENPGKRADRDMTAKDFVDRCMAALYGSARPFQAGNA